MDKRRRGRPHYSQPGGWRYLIVDRLKAVSYFCIPCLTASWRRWL
jgi:hypothetical protein